MLATLTILAVLLAIIGGLCNIVVFVIGTTFTILVTIAELCSGIAGIILGVAFIDVVIYNMKNRNK